ncbi:MAG: hypothetical protein KAR54_03430 [Candidatus Pacebacteria bacterium]|nr:hypothetical protein [Candidatus Paceibacterota bacterium]
MKTVTKVIGGTVAVIVVGVLASSSASAYRGDYSEQGPEYSSERHAEMTKAMNDNDYNAWVGLMGDRGRVTQVINEENFSRFTEARKLAQEGKYEEADTIREELGLRTRDGERVGAHRGMMDGYHGQNKGGR